MATAFRHPILDTVAGATDARQSTIGVCLSGGGYRAALFHLGALRRLNETGMLSRVTLFSSVSGGSILNGLLAMAWDRLKKDTHGVFTNFEQLVELPLREFCSRDIRSYPLLWGRLLPWNWWRFLFLGESATTLLAREYDRHLFRGTTLAHLSQVRRKGGPDFTFCSSCLQTGVNFEFNSTRVGDYKIGHAAVRSLPLADAVAASSAFPIAFPPYVLDLGKKGMRFRGGSIPRGPDVPGFERPLLTDGGVYDNLGLEPVWKICGVIFCSDGGAPFQLWDGLFPSFISRLFRTQKVVQNQARSVRKRWLIASYKDKGCQGAYWGLGTDIANYGEAIPGYRGECLAKICRIRTDLNRFSEGEQLVLMNHGWLLAKAALKRHFPSAVFIPGTAPAAALLPSVAAEQALRR